MSSEALALFPELVAQELEPRSMGLLPSQRLEELILAGYIRADVPILPDQVQPSSLDLRLGATAYRVRASFLPTRLATVRKKLQELATAEIDLSEPALLKRGEVYIVPLREELSLPESLSGMANPKSTTGRLDIFTRLITDYGIAFEEVPNGYKGKLYAEIVPLTFSVIVREDTRLNQLRLRRGDRPSTDAMLRRMNEKEPLVYSQDASLCAGDDLGGLKVVSGSERY